MANGSDHWDLLGAIQACPKTAVVVAGPAPSGKTAAAVGLYRHYLSDPTRPQCAILAPNQLTVQSLRRKLIDESGSAVAAAPRVMTFTALAGQILQAAGQSGERITPLHRRMALEGIIADLVGAGGLKTLAAVADTPGLVAAIDRSIAELKRAAVEPETLAEAIGDDGKHRDLLAVYQRYQEYLHERNLYDEEGRMWQAREVLAQAGGELLTGPDGDLRAVVVDGFADFTPTQLQILRLLTPSLEKLVIMLPIAADGRDKLWQWTHRQFQRIAAVFGDSFARIDAPRLVDSDAPAPADLVFAPSEGQTSWPANLHAVAAAGLDSECRAIGRWVKRHLAEGARAEDLLIIARQAGPYKEGLRRVFAEAGLPVPAAEVALGDTGLGRMLLCVAGLADGFDSADVLAVLGASYFRPQSLGDYPDNAAEIAEAVIRLANVIGGRERYASAFDWVGQRIDRKLQSGADHFTSPLEQMLANAGPAAIADAGRMVEVLLASVDPIAAGGPVGELARCARGLVNTIVRPGLAGDDSTVAADLRAWAGLCAALDELAELGEIPGVDERMTSAGFVASLGRLLHETPVRCERSAGTVAVTGALDVRAVRAEHVWLAGLNERVFPASSADQALIGEADRRRWAERANLPLDGRDDLTAREMLLFYLTAARADRTLTVSWLYSDDTGRPLGRSGFADALFRPYASADAHIQALPPAEFAPPDERVASRRELLNSAMTAAATAADDPIALDRRLALARQLHRGGLGMLARPLWALHRRWTPGGCDAYDGVLDDPALLAEVARRYPHEVVFSASQLNTYRYCPWRYFAERLLNLGELPEPDEELLPSQRGTLVHAVLCRMMVTLGESGPVMVEDLAGEAAMAALDAAIAAEASTVSGRVACRGLWENELTQLRHDILRYLTRHTAQSLPGERVKFLEVGFGMAGDTASGSCEEPLVLDGPHGPVRLRGKIDRVDIIDTDDGPKAFVVDYKTGRLPKADEDLQLPIYIHAAERATGVPSAGGAFHAVSAKEKTDRYLAEMVVSRGKVVPCAGYRDTLTLAIDTLHSVVGQIAAGRFDLLGDHDCAATWCPLRRVCGYSEGRRVFKLGDSMEGSNE